MRNVEILGVASGWGARDRRCEDGPRTLEASGVLQCLNHETQTILSFEMLNIVDLAPCQDVLACVAEIDHRLALTVSTKIRKHVLPIVVGGDHACAVGTWSGVRAALPPQQELGLIWVDAHMDSHVPATSPSGALHGMPLACLLGEGPEILTTLAGPAPKLNPKHVCLLGVRSYERGEQLLLDRLGVRVFSMEEVRIRGLERVWQEAVSYVTQGDAGYGITIDLDAIDPCDAPGVGSPVSNGIAGADLVRVAQSLYSDPRLLAVEIAEYNPHVDRDRVTLSLLQRLISAVVCGKGLA